MVIKIKSGKCKKCGENFLYDFESGGDWADTALGYMLQWWCPRCGEMWPLIRDPNPKKMFTDISINQRKDVARDVSMKYNIDFKVCQDEAKVMLGTTQIEFSQEFSKRLKNLFGISVSPKSIRRLASRSGGL